MRPLLKQKNKTSNMMLNLIIALCPIIIFATIKNGYIPYSKGYDISPVYPLIFIITGALSTFLFETIYNLIFNKKNIKESIKNSYALIPGLILSLILPINTPISILIFGSFIASIFGKMLFGGFGQNIFNPALVGRLFIISTYAMVISQNGGYTNAYELDAVSSATPLTNASMQINLGTYETLVEPYGGITNFIIGNHSGALGETSSILIIIALIYLIATKTIKWRIPITYLSTVFLSTLIIGIINGQGLWYPVFALCSGGLLFGATFMATDPVTSPITKKGQWIYGISLGILTVTFRYLTPYPEGVLTSILTMNMLVFIIDNLGLKDKYKYLPIIILLIIGSFLSIRIGYKFNNIDTETDPNYSIINIEQNKNKIIYTVSQKGYVGPIKAKIIIENDKILSYEILEQSESFYQKVEDADYVNKLLNEQDNLKEIDTISGATVSSTALKKMLINTLEGYKKGNYKNFEGNNQEVEENKDFKILEVTGNVYKIEQKSFGGNMVLEITINDSKVTKINLISYNDTCISRNQTNEYYTCPEYLEEGYLQKIIENNEIDTISGATVSSSAIKNAIKNVMEVYNEK